MRCAEYAPLWEVNVNNVIDEESVYVYGTAYDAAREQVWASVFVGDLTALVRRQGVHNHLLRIGAGGAATDIYEVADFRPASFFSPNFFLNRRGELFLHNPKGSVIRRYSPSADLLQETPLNANAFALTPHGEGILAYCPHESESFRHYAADGTLLWSRNLPLPVSQVFLRSIGEEAWAFTITSEVAAIRFNTDGRIVGFERLMPTILRFCGGGSNEAMGHELAFQMSLTDVTPGPTEGSSLLHFYPLDSGKGKNRDALLLLHEWSKGVRSLPWPQQFQSLIGASGSDTLIAGSGKSNAGEAMQSRIAAVTAPDWRKARRYP